MDSAPLSNHAPMKSIKKYLEKKRPLGGRKFPQRQPGFDTTKDSQLDQDLHTQTERQSLSSRQSSPTAGTFDSQHLLPQSAGERSARSSMLSSEPHHNPALDAPLPPLPSSDGLEAQGDALHPSPLGSHPLKTPKTRSPKLEPDDIGSRNTTRTVRTAEPAKTPDRAGSPFDLRPPPPVRTEKTSEGLTELLMSTDHLHVILRDRIRLSKFAEFLGQCKPGLLQVLARYLAAQKAIMAVEYANTVAEKMMVVPGDQVSAIPCAAAMLDLRFERRSDRALQTLVVNALPMYIKHTLTRSIITQLIGEVTGENKMPFPGEFINGLGASFCLSDAGDTTHPIVYVSKAFCHLTQYGGDHVIGRNCRFLQGPKRDEQALARIRLALQEDLEYFGPIVNYRRDGSSFVNLLTVAPLVDDEGTVKYHLGAQLDISRLIRDGTVFHGFEERIMQERARQKQERMKKNLSTRSSLERGVDFNTDAQVVGNAVKSARQGTSGKLLELTQMVSLERCVMDQALRTGRGPQQHDASKTATEAQSRPKTASRTGKILPNPTFHAETSSTGKPSSKIPEGRNLFNERLAGELPGVYHDYILIRAWPSLRIVFTSTSMREKSGSLLHSPFLDHVSASPGVLSELKYAFTAGRSVSAKIQFTTSVGDIDGMPKSSQGINRTRTTLADSGDETETQGNIHPSQKPSTLWMSATPLIGSDGLPGVWIVLLIEQDSAANDAKDETEALTSQNLRSKQHPRVQKHGPGRETPQDVSIIQIQRPRLDGHRRNHARQHIASQKVPDVTVSGEQPSDSDGIEEEWQNALLQELQPEREAPVSP